MRLRSRKATFVTRVKLQVVIAKVEVSPNAR